MSERWLPVKGYEGLYEVSDLGRFRNSKRMKLKKTTPDKFGYLQVRLCKDGIPATKLAHRLVLEAFVGPCPEGMETRHLDGDPTNNKVCNLAWGTVEENRWDTVKHGNHPNQKKKKCPRGHKLEEPNLVESSPHRRCKACLKAWRWARYHSLHKDEKVMQEVSDSNYEDIMAVRTSCQFAV